MSQGKFLRKWAEWISLHLHSIQFYMALSFSTLIILLIALFGYFAYEKFTDTLEKNAEEYTIQLSEQVKENIDYYIGYMDSIASVVEQNPSFQRYFSGYQTLSAQEQTIEREKIKELFKSFINARNDIVSIFIFGYNGLVLQSDENLKVKPHVTIENQEWYQAAKQAQGKSVVSSSHVQMFVKQPRWVVSLSKELKSVDQGERKGIFLIDLNYRIIDQICKKVDLGTKGYIFIIDQQGNIVYHPQQQLIYSRLKEEMIPQVLNAQGRSFIHEKDGEKKLFSITKSSLTGWMIVSVTNVNEMVMDHQETEQFFMMMVIVSILLALLVSVVLSTIISKPIKKLELSMKQVEQGNFDIELDTYAKHEVGRLSKAFNLMTGKIKELMEEIVEEQQALRKSEIKVLQSQINPHFLYNTLDSIIWMAECNQNQKVVLMTSALAKLFRISLNKGEEIITIGGELEHVKNYLVIQKMRYNNKLDYLIDVDQEIQSYKTLKLILQPLVENAIYHGIKNQPEKGIIHITGKEVDGKIQLQVIDNGVGMDPEQLKNIYSEEQRKKSKGNGVGVKNVHERLQVYFGKEYGLSFESEVGKGTIVTILIPVVKSL